MGRIIIIAQLVKTQNLFFTRTMMVTMLPGRVIAEKETHGKDDLKTQ
ncbi:hypothetical protein [Sporosarcina globispora]|nr:hypothetical protein [Sporosarcina globispora]